MSCEPAELEKIAAEAARIGGKLLNGFFGKVNPASIEAKTLNDWVSAADHASEEAIIAFLEKEVAGHSIYTEEAGYSPGIDIGGNYCWIIDPLDGTTNFLRKFPLWAVSVGVEYRDNPQMKWGEIIAGAVNVPPTGEMFRASKDNGAYRNDKKISVGAGHGLGQSLIGTGFPFRVPQLLNLHTNILKRILSVCADVRRPGAAAVDLCYTAMGIYDGFWEFDLFPWDVAAGSLIIRESGGVVGGINGETDFMTTGDILTAHPRIYPEMLHRIKSSLKRSEHYPRQVDKSPPRDTK